MRQLKPLIETLELFLDCNADGKERGMMDKLELQERMRVYILRIKDFLAAEWLS